MHAPPNIQAGKFWLLRFQRSLWPQTFIFLLFLFLTTPGILRAAGVVLVANHNVPVNRLSKCEVKNIFLTRVQTIQGVRIRPVMLGDKVITKRFLRTEVGKTPAQFSNYYKKMIFTGRGRPLPKIESEEAVLAYVSSTSGGLGYVSMDAVTDDVKIIQVGGVE